MPTRHLRRAPLLLLAMLVLATPMPARAADPPLGEAVTLPDGTVLPPMPVDQITPTAQSEMLAENGGLVADEEGSTFGPLVETSVAAEGAAVEAASPLIVAEAAVAGPGGPLPNQLRREVLGFLPYWKLDATTRSALRMDLLSTIAYFSIGVQSNGYLARGPATSPTVGWSGWTSSAMTSVINAAHARGVRVVPTITMMAWNGDYSAMSALLNSPTYRGRLVADVVKVVGDRRADGVNIDFEPVPSSLRSQFTALVRAIKAGLVAAGVGSYVTVDTMAGAATWSTGYDVVGLTASGAADALMVMAYDFHYAGSARAGGVAPMDSNTIFSAVDAMRDHLARVPAGKIIWGVPYYGRAWNTTGATVNSTVRSPVQSAAFSYYGTDGGTPFGGKVLAARYGRKWDDLGQVPWFVFRAADGLYRQGYYDDPTSLGRKYDFVQRNDVAGIGIWSLGMDTGVSDLWNVIEDRFLKHQLRLAGDDRYATAARVSSATFVPGVPVAYVATGSDFPDALAAGPAAAKGGGPVLLTQRTFVPPATASELARLAPARIVVLGGTAVISDAVLANLRGYATSGVATRIAGADRYATAARTSAATFAPGVPVAYVATGASFPDALAGGVAAARQKGPVLLVTAGSVTPATASELTRLKPGRIVVLGGATVIGDAVVSSLRSYATSGTVTRLAGADRYATAIEVSRATTGTDDPRTVYIATGVTFADGLSGTPAAARANGPLLIVPNGSLTAPIANELRRLDPPRIVILGGTSAVSSTIAAQIAALWD
ncbi:MAG TPA: cell wall-binding repeat-containing protein [Candidatus Limnocylindrales bacterium]|nr:cell wall-binding repeat-containing protein [Candidatus Limnocylindrales bacterium]